MELSNVHLVALGGFLVAAAFGAIAHRTRFCVMGAISDWVNIGDTMRLRAWFLAIGVAVIGAQLLAGFAPIDLHKSIYLTTNFGWLGHIVGGFLLGVGMTLASGCGQRNLVLAGGGNLKSIVVLLALAITADMTLRGLLAPFRIDVIQATNIDLSGHGLADQAVPTLLAQLIGRDSAAAVHAALAALLGVGLVVFVFSSRDFRRRFDQILAGVGVGVAVVAGWYVTGVLGSDEFEPVPLQSLSFVAPIAESLQYVMTYTGTTINFGVATIFGMVVGSAIYAFATRSFRIEGFASAQDLLRHLAGGALVGFGGVAALGCTIGQAVTGVSTLATGSFLTLGAIVFGSALTMKVEYHLLDQRGFWRAMRMGLADMRLLPAPRNPKTV